jgi:hypothetical protein
MTTADTNKDSTSEEEGNYVSPFTTSPADPQSEAAWRVPSNLVGGIEGRLVKYLPDLCSLLRTNDSVRLADKIRGLSAIYLFHEHKQHAATAAQRKKRITRMLSALSASDVIYDIVRQSIDDDIEFSRSDAGLALLKYLGAVLEVRGKLEEEASRLGPPSKADSKRLGETPTQAFLICAHLLWLEEARVDPSTRAEDYRLWLTLLFETVTGEPNRSFEKAIRTRRTRDARRKVMEGHSP